MMHNVVDSRSEDTIENVGRVSSHDDQIGSHFGGNSQDRVGGSAGADMDKRWHRKLPAKLRQLFFRLTDYRHILVIRSLRHKGRKTLDSVSQMQSAIGVKKRTRRAHQMLGSLSRAKAYGTDDCLIHVPTSQKRSLPPKPTNSVRNPSACACFKN